MAVKSFKKLNSADRNLNLVQDNIETFSIPLVKNPLLDGQLIEDQELVTGQDNIINHKLGRVLRGWLIVRQNAAADIYDTQADNSLPNLTLWLRSSADCTISLYVF